LSEDTSSLHERRVEIEDIAAKCPAILKTRLTRKGRNSDATQIAEKMGYGGNQLSALTGILEELYRAGMDYDAELIEINPRRNSRWQIRCVDARLIIATTLFRHSERKGSLPKNGNTRKKSKLQNRLAYVKLDGDIGISATGRTRLQPST
jgi:succinyl-CoA synthetase beta subunit